MLVYNGVEMIREQIKNDLKEAIVKSGVEVEDVHLEHPANFKHGDYSSNIALTLQNVVAGEVVKNFPENDYLEKIEVAGPGFINFFLKKSFLQNQVGGILGQDRSYGISAKSKEQRAKTKIQVEFISANPTGPLHVGNARGGFAGDVLANVLEKRAIKFNESITSMIEVFRWRSWPSR